MCDVLFTIHIQIHTYFCFYFFKRFSCFNKTRYFELDWFRSKNLLITCFRTNPLFKDEEESQSRESMDKECYKPSSYSSGYWSYKGTSSIIQNIFFFTIFAFAGAQPAESGLLHMTKLLENNSELECCNSVPHPVWPGVGSSKGGERGRKVKVVDCKPDRLDRGRLTGCKVSSQLKRMKDDNFILGKSHLIERRNNDTRSQKKLQEDRCFGIRHQPVSGKYDGQNDSLVTNSILLMTGYSSVEENDDSENEEAAKEVVTQKSRDDMDRVIEELASAVRQSKGVTVLTNAIGKTKYKNDDKARGHKYQYANQEQKKIQRRRSLEERNLRQLNKDSKHKENFGYTSDDSEASIRNTRRTEARNQSSLSHSSSSNYDTLQLRDQDFKNPLKSSTRVNHYGPRQSNHQVGVDPSSWFLAHRDPRPLRTDLDFKNYQYNYDLFRAEEILRANMAKKKLPYKSNTGSPYFMEGWNNGFHVRKRTRRKTFVLFLKTLCFLLLLSSFVLVIVAVSVFLTKGNNKI